MPDYSYGGQLQWGRGRGCGFIEGSCYKWVGPTVLNTSKEEVRDEGNMDTLPFCNRSQMERERCVDQRYAIGVCKIKSYPAKLPEQFRVSIHTCIYMLYIIMGKLMQLCLPTLSASLIGH